MHAGCRRPAVPQITPAHAPFTHRTAWDFPRLRLAFELRGGQLPVRAHTILSARKRLPKPHLDAAARDMSTGLRLPRNWGLKFFGEFLATLLEPYCHRNRCKSTWYACPRHKIRRTLELERSCFRRNPEFSARDSFFKPSTLQGVLKGRGYPVRINLIPFRVMCGWLRAET